MFGEKYFNKPKYPNDSLTVSTANLDDTSDPNSPATMSTTTKPPAAGQTPPSHPPDLTNSYFHQQRALLVSEIATVRPQHQPSHIPPQPDRTTTNSPFPHQALDTTLTQLNRLNRSLESVTAVGNEFSSVEALWSQFESVMGNMAQNGAEQQARAGAQEEGSDGETLRRSGEEEGEEVKV